MRTALMIFVSLALAAVVGIVCFTKGVNLVRGGLIENYPTVQGLLKGAQIEVDTLFSLTLSAEDDSALFKSLGSSPGNAQAVTINIPFHGYLGINPHRMIRTIQADDKAVEVWSPGIVVRSYELDFDNLRINNEAVNISADTKKAIRGFVIPVIEKNKDLKTQAKDNVAKAMMFYFIPYKYDLRVYFENTQHPLPTVVGINKSVNDAVKESIEN